MRQVTQEQFFAALKADPRDIMPSIQPGPYPYTSLWQDQRSRFGTAFGKSVGRLINPGVTTTDYFLADGE